MGADIEGGVENRLDQLDWAEIHADLDAQGWSIAPRLLTHAEADEVSGLYQRPEGFRSQVVMARHGFGRGEYKYFSYPLPPLIQTLRTAAYRRLVEDVYPRVRQPARSLRSEK